MNDRASPKIGENRIPQIKRVKGRAVHCLCEDTQWTCCGLSV